jgi:hypothetical protein
VTAILVLFAVIRALLGVAPFVAAGPLIPLLGFPPNEATTTAIVFARLFGVRDVGLGAIIVWSTQHPDTLPAVLVLNAATDLGDLGAFLLGMRGRPDLHRPLGICASIAGSACLAWLVLLAIGATGQ